MTTPCCKDCAYFEPGMGMSPDTGHCHRYPAAWEEQESDYYFPEMDRESWCGEFKAAEPKEPEEDREVGCHLPHCGRGVRSPSPQDPGAVLLRCPRCSHKVTIFQVYPKPINFCPQCGFSLPQNPEKSPLAE